MIAAEGSFLNRLSRCAPFARLRGVAFAAAARLHLVRFDRTRPDRAQLRTLLGLVHRGRRTRFGREHDFARIRTADDFRRLVPLRTPAALALKTEADPKGLLASHRRAMTTALALLSSTAPAARLLEGRVICPESQRLHLPALARPSLDGLGEPTCVIDADTVSLPPPHQKRVGLLSRPEAPLAVEDPRFSGFRLLVDHGAYFEFVCAEADEPQPPRVGIAEVRVGVDYELAITSPGGWWACRSGLFVAFERLCPPLFRILAPPARTADPETQRRSPDTLPALPEFVPGLWSMLADRGR